MSFGFKNTRVTYQRLVDQVFRQQIGRNVEIYVDDIIIKSLEMVDFVDELEETLATLRDVGLKLNPTKCTFEVSSWKFFGYIISHKGLRTNPEKTQASGP